MIIHYLWFIFKVGFVPGETIVATVRVVNYSTRLIKPISVALVQILSFHGERFGHLTQHTKNKKEEVVSCKSAHSIAPQSHDFSEEIRLTIPPVCSSTVASRIIEVSYEVKLNFDADGFHSSKDLVIPIVMGTVPLYDHSNPRPSSIRPPDYQFLPSIFPPSGSDDSLPDYDQIVGDIYETNAASFRPYYPYYGGF